MLKLSKVYKFLLRYFFFLYYGKVNFENGCKDKIEKIYKINKFGNFVYNLKNTRIYTDSRDVAYISSSNTIISNVSIQLARKIPDNCSVKIGTPKFLRYLKGNSISLLCGSLGVKNYWHWLFDTLPRIYLINKIYKFKKKDFFLVPSLKENFQRESLNFLGLKNCIDFNQQKHVKTENLFCTNPELMKWRGGKKKTYFPKWMLNFLRKKFLKKYTYKFKNLKKIYISREDSFLRKYRHCRNELDIIKYLKNNGFEKIILSNYSFLDQVKIFSQADFIISIHGAAFANILFCKKKCNIIEIKSEITSNVIKNLADSLKLKNYRDIKCKLLKRFANIGDNYGTFYCNIRVLKKNLEKLGLKTY